ncbi:tetratricopeptide repeat protein [Pelagibacteraceae bacterium]|jgi:cytochrome c-type biogenesis protein CcmH/NrfG|nr:tetratricopeptide repeat protein [Pelagibacteraceae bacterium]
MIKNFKILFVVMLFLNLYQEVLANNNFFKEAKKKFNEKKIEDSKFLFQRDIVYNPKNAESYLYLAKIYKKEENQKKELKNLNTALLLEPKNEEAMQMLIEIKLENSDYSKVKELIKNFKSICKNLCEKTKLFDEKLKNIEPKNDT